MAESEAAGWDAITDALERAHPGIVPAHWSTGVRYHDGGSDPLDGVSAYFVDNSGAGGASHWHYVSYGLSDLYEKSTGKVEDPALSGWGFELTFRLKVAGPDEPVPVWPADLLQNAARYVIGTGRHLTPGQHIDLHAPISDVAPTLLRALLIVPDPQLYPTTTPFGRVRFAQLVGITSAELDAALRWKMDGIAALLGTHDPMYLTDLDRTSITDDPVVAEAIRLGTARDGASADTLVFAEGGAEIDRDGLRVVISKSGVATFKAVLEARLRARQTLLLTSRAGDFPVMFHRAGGLDPVDTNHGADPEPEEARWAAGADRTDVWVTPDGIAEIVADLPSALGSYRFTTLPDTVFEVV